jgi:hypothetical protein
MKEQLHPMRDTEVRREQQAKAIENIGHFASTSRAVVPEALPAASMNAVTPLELLGEPLSIEEVAMLLGCSAWTIRQRYLPEGLPHVRASATGKIVFFRKQVIDWILKRQQKKGGNRP